MVRSGVAGNLYGGKNGLLAEGTRGAGAGRHGRSKIREIVQDAHPEASTHRNWVECSAPLVKGVKNNRGGVSVANTKGGESGRGETKLSFT